MGSRYSRFCSPASLQRQLLQIGASPLDQLADLPEYAAPMDDGASVVELEGGIGDGDLAAPARNDRSALHRSLVQLRTTFGRQSLSRLFRTRTLSWLHHCQCGWSLQCVLQVLLPTGSRSCL